MRAFNFPKKSGTKTYTIFTIISAILCVLILIKFNIKIKKEYLFLISSFISLVSILYAVKKASQTISEIVFNEDNVKVIFKNLRTDPIEVQIDKLLVYIELDKVIFKNNSYELIGIAHKKQMADLNSWQDFTEFLKNSSRAKIKLS